MIKTNITSLTYFNKLMDAFLNFLSFIAAFYIHQGVLSKFEFLELDKIPSPFFYIELFVICIILVNFIGTSNSYYGYDRFCDSQVIVKKWLSTYVQAFAYTILIFYLFKRFIPSRILVSVYFSVILLFSLSFRYLERKVMQFLYGRGRYLQNVIIVGTGIESEMVVNELQTNEQWGFNVVGVLERYQNETPSFKYQDLVFNRVMILEEFLKNNVVDLVIFAVNNEEVNSVRRYISLCEQMGVMTMINLDNFEMKIAKTHVEYLGIIPMITFSTVPTRYRLILVKYVLDRIITALSLIFFVPFVFLPIIIAIKLSSKGPAIFTQERVGINGRKFKMYKFRTMVDGAEDLLDGLRDQSDVDGPVFKLKEDPRITKFGSILRRYSLDELPQLFNILKGEMSIVGPRPPIQVEVDRYTNEFHRRLSMKPGLTCLWQISGRSDIDFKTWMEMDMKYIDTWSMIGDIIIIIRTIPVILTRKGAY